MSKDELVSYHDKRPFRPFAIHLTDGRSFDVHHPEFLARSPDASTLIYWFDLGRREEIDSHHITSLEQLPEKTTTNGPRKKK